MTNLDAFRDKFSQSGIRILDGALEEARKRNQNYISQEHLLYALILQESDLFNAEMQHVSADASFIRAEVERLLEYSRKHHGEGFRIAPETTNIFKNSMEKARAENRRVIDASDILFSFINDSHSPCSVKYCRMSR